MIIGKSFEGRYLECRRPDETGKKWITASDCLLCDGKTFKSCGNGWKKFHLFSRTERAFANDSEKHLLNREFKWVSPNDLLCPEPSWNDEEEAKKRILEDEFRLEQFEAVKKEGIKEHLMCDTYINIPENSDFIENKFYVSDGVHRMWHSRWMKVEYVFIRCDIWDMGGK
jgi:hypothetical protein